MVNQGGPGKPDRFFLSQSCQMCHTFGRGILCFYQFLLEEASCIRENILCEEYVVKVWEGMVQNSLSCHTIPKAWLAPWNMCSFHAVLYRQYCMLEDSSTKYEMSDISIYV